LAGAQHLSQLELRVRVALFCGLSELTYREVLCLSLAQCLGFCLREQHGGEERNKKKFLHGRESIFCSALIFAHLCPIENDALEEGRPTKATLSVTTSATDHRSAASIVTDLGTDVEGPLMAEGVWKRVLKAVC
jgi:hypothetical protein